MTFAQKLIMFGVFMAPIAFGVCVMTYLEWKSRRDK